MNSTRSLLSSLAALIALSMVPLCAQDTVTIPKSRLQELERKEKELDALKPELNKARGETEKLQRAKEKAEKEKAKAESDRAKAQSEAAQLTKARQAAEEKAAAATAEPAIAHDTPPLATLPPLKKGDLVDAMDLMNHYRADAAGAAQRYGKQRIRVRGVVTAFDKPMFQSPYHLFLRTTERRWVVQCVVYPPDQFKAVFPTEHGEALVGLTRSEARLTLARVGQTVEVEGLSRGLDGQALKLSGCQLKLAE